MPAEMKAPLSLTWSEDAQALHLLDQRLLPGEIVYLAYHDAGGVRDAIAQMVVRGAPAIGVAAAYGIYLGARALPEDGTFLPRLEAIARDMASARPTAVNLPWAVSRMLAHAKAEKNAPPDACKRALLQEAKAIHAEDIDICRRIGEALLPELRDGMGILTHCNAGQLATARYGTALSPIYLAHERGLRLHIYADETRPRLQGANLTAFELSAQGIDTTVICDSMAATVMSQGRIGCCIVGCDRVAANGDTANKIGTLGVAILAKHYGIPFYVAAPSPTIDLQCPDGTHIPIEERSGDEIALIRGVRIVPEGVSLYNPSFDVTPSALITGFATEYGLLTPPFSQLSPQKSNPWA